MNRRTGFIFILLLLYSFGYGQKRHFQHITTADGLSQSEVYSFLEDSQGFLWIGTVYGLNKYDGYEITTFYSDQEDSGEITNNTIRSLKEDKWKRIWIGTDNGLNVYDSRQEQIHQIKIPAFQHGSLMISDILVSDEEILLATSEGILRSDISSESYDEIGNSFTRIQLPDKIQGKTFLLQEDKEGVIWVSTNRTLSALVFKDGVKEPFLLEHISSDKIRGIRSFTHDRHENIWIATFDQGIFRYDRSNGNVAAFNHGSSNESVTTSNISAITTDAESNIWVGTRDKGLLFLSENQLLEKQPKFESIQNNPFNDRSLNSNLIYSLYFTDKLWIGTIGSGINIYDPMQKEFNHYRIPPTTDQNATGSNFVRSVYGDQENNIWIGTHSNGLFHLDKQNHSFRKVGFGTQSVFHISKLRKDRLLICSGKGVTIVKRENGKQLQLKNTMVSDASFFAAKSKDDVLWVATLQGLIRCVIDGQQIIVDKVWDAGTSPSLSLSNCRVIYYEEVSNQLFVGTEGGGLNVINLNENHQVVDISVYQNNDRPGSLRNNFIRSITGDKNGNIWLGTYEGLIKVIRNEDLELVSFVSYTTKDGLPNNMVQFVVEDNLGKLWIGTNKGLSKFDPETEQFVQYTVSDGIQSNEFSEHAVYKKSDGEIIAGGINGINTFYPENIHPSSNKPTTTITNFYLFDKEISVSQKNREDFPLKKSIVYTDSLFLQPRQNSFGFKFSALTYLNPDKVKYAYKLEGFDENWNYTDGSNRLANYTNLEFGDYIFKVKSTNNDGIWEDSVKSIYIHIKTPFFYTGVAYVIYVLFIILIIIYFTNYSLIKYTTKKKMLLENEHNQQLHELDELRTRFFINISHDLRTPLTLISSPLSLVLKDASLKEETRKRLRIAHRNVQKLKYITEQLLDISKADAGKLTFHPKNGDFIAFIKLEIAHFTDAVRDKGLQLKITFDQPTYNCRFDPDIISKIFFNLISNAIKYTKEGQISIEVSLSDNSEIDNPDHPGYSHYLKMVIADSGPGIPQEDLHKIFDRFYQGNNKNIDGYGIGLSHCNDLIEAHEGAIKAESIAGSGTIFTVYIPFLELSGEAPSQDNLSVTIPDIDQENRLFADTRDHQKHLNLKKVLIVEDNSDMRAFIIEELEHEYKTIEATDGIEGLALCNKHSPDLILSDVMMPNMDGIELCRRLKSDVKTSHIPIILLTAKGDSKMKYEGLEKGADDYIQKPFEMEHLLIRIRNLIKSKDQYKENFQSIDQITPSSVEVSDSDREFLSELMATIEKGIPDPDFRVNTLESTLGMSHTNLHRKIKQLTGKSAKDIVISMRMKRAKQILTDSENIRISEVAYHVGFSNPKYFSKCFKEYYGVLPSDFSIN